MGLRRDAETSAVSQRTILEWAACVDCPEADVVVIGCSAFRACADGFIDQVRGSVVRGQRACHNQAQLQS